jgi:putative phage-type endonuclease
MQTARANKWYNDDLTIDALLYRDIDVVDYANSCVALSHTFCERDAEHRVAVRRASHERTRLILADLLKNRPGVPQRTPEWYEARKTVITASDAAQALGQGKFGTQLEFFHRKLGLVTVDYSNLPPLQWGVKYEPAAIYVYRHMFGVRVHDFGLLMHPDHPFIGASPDGINEHGVMLEIKCPYRRELDGTVPTQYYMQMQLQMEVCGLDDCDYFECEFQELDEYDFSRLPANRYRKGGIVTRGTTHEYKFCFGDEACPEAEVLDWVQKARGTLFVLNKHDVIRVARNIAFVTETIRALAGISSQLAAFRDDPSSLPPLPVPRKRAKGPCLFLDSDGE